MGQGKTASRTDGFLRDRRKTGKTKSALTEMDPFLRAFPARSLSRIPTTNDLRKRLMVDPNLRLMVGSGRSERCHLSRRTAILAASPIATRALNDMTAQYHEGRIVGHISRDATAIPLREPPPTRSATSRSRRSPNGSEGASKKAVAELDRAWGVRRTARERSASGRAPSCASMSPTSASP